MYEKFYNLRERPFALSPDPEYLYLSRVHGEALNSLRYGIESRAGFIVVTGEIGAGKTTLLQTLLQRLDERATVARVVNTTLEPRELLEAIALDFGIDTAGKSKPYMLRDLGQFLVAQRAEGRRPLLVIDEAQNLSAAALEEIRLLSNLETEKSKLLQILLVGQPNLRDTIASAELEQFRQRIAVSYHLSALDAPDTTGYIHYRLAHAAIGEPPGFSAEAAALVHRASKGVPRIVNVICDAALVFGYAEERRNIDLGLLEEVLEELKATGVLNTDAGSLEAPAAAAASEGALARPAVAAAAGDGRTIRFERPSAPSATVSEIRPQPDLSRIQQEVNERAAQLKAREQALERRERELSEQRRVMAEEYRLLHHLRSPGPTTGRTAGGAPHRAAVHTPTGVRAEPRSGVLSWLKRVLAGSRAAVEGR